MKKFVLAGIVLGFIALPALAQAQRNVYLVPYTSCAAAVAPPTVIATGDEEIPCFQIVIRYGFTPQVPTYKIQWHEFRTTSDPWCAMMPRTKQSTAACAAFWYDQLAPGNEYIGITTTQEKTHCLWWYN